MLRRAPLSRWIWTASAGFTCIGRMNQRGSYAPIGTSAKSGAPHRVRIDRKSTRLNSSHLVISYAVFCLKKQNEWMGPPRVLQEPGVAPQATFLSLTGAEVVESLPRIILPLAASVHPQTFALLILPRTAR